MEAGKELYRKLSVTHSLCDKAIKELDGIYSCTIDDLDVVVGNAQQKIRRGIEELTEAMQYMHRMSWDGVHIAETKREAEHEKH